MIEQRASFRSNARMKHGPFLPVAGYSRVAMLVLGCAALSIVIGLVTLIGWAADVQWLADLFRTGIAMMPNAAVCAVSAGLALVFLTLGRHNAAAIFGTVPGIVGIATLIQHLSGITLGIDMVPAYREWGEKGTLAPGRMGPPAAVCFSLLGVALVLITRSGVARQIAVAAGLVVIGISMLSIVGYAFGADSLYSLPHSTAIAIQTASALFALGIGVVASVRECEPLRTLSENSAAGVLVRRVLPYLILTPLVVGWLRVQGETAGWYDSAFGTAIFALILIAFFAGLLWRAASTIRSYEAPLRESRERLEGVLGSISDRFQTVDKRWRLTYHNAAMRRALAAAGIDAGAMLGKNLFDAFPELNNAAYAPKLRVAMEQRTEVEFEIGYESGRRWLAMRASPIPDGGLAIVSHDITARKHEGELAAAHERELRLITDHAPVLISYCDANARYKFVNKPYAERFGLTPGDIIGKRIPEVVGDAAYATFRDHVAETLTGKSLQFETEIPYQIGGPRYMHAAYVPERDAKGNVVGLVAALVDITARKRAELALRSQLELTQAITDNSAAALFMIDTRGYCTFMNPAGQRMLGWTFEEISRKPLHEMIHHHYPDGRPYPMTECPIERALPGNFGMREHEDMFIRSNGEFFPVLVGATPIADAQSGATSMVIEVRDVTMRRMAEREIAQAARRKDEFLATLAHELRNPLAPIRNMLEIVGRKDIDAQMLGRAREIMDRQLNQLVRLIDDLLDVTRISQGKIELRLESIELAGVVQQSVETISGMLERSKQQLTVTLPSEPIHLRADSVRLSQVFSNLLNNACKFSKSGAAGRITLSAAQEADEVVIRVSDNGVGIPANMLSQIFEAFTQVDSTLERSQGGLGIGLALVKSLVEMHGGSVKAHSAGAGAGSEFEVRLPRDAAPRPNMQPVAVDPVSLSASLRVLVADDNADAATSMALLLKAMGQEVVSVGNGLEAIELADTYRPDVILMDIGMPGLNGYEACRRIRAQPSGKAIVMVALTGWGQDEDRRKSREAGFDEHLVKPADPAALRKLFASLSMRESSRQPDADGVHTTGHD